MKIDRLDVYYVEMPLIYPWRTAYGEDYDIHSVLVKATERGAHGVVGVDAVLRADVPAGERGLGVLSRHGGVRAVRRRARVRGPPRT